MSISVVVIAKNAADIIEKNLKSVQFANEVILIDIESTDNTTALAKKYCTKIFSYGKDSKFVEPVRAFALAKVSKDWVLVLDADEEIPESLAKKLVEIDQDDSGEAYYLARKNMVTGAWMKHTGWWPDYQLRFFKNGLVSWSEKIHSQPIVKSKSKPSFLEAKEDLAILHHNYKDVSDYLKRFDRYTDIEAEQKAKTEKANFVISQSSLLKAFSDDWFRRFFAKEGYRDGIRGFYLSTMQAAYQMTVQMKIFDHYQHDEELEKNNQENLIKDLHKFKKELNYWINDLEMKNKKGFEKLIFIIKRKFNL